MEYVCSMMCQEFLSMEAHRISGMKPLKDALNIVYGTVLERLERPSQALFGKYSVYNNLKRHWRMEIGWGIRANLWKDRIRKCESLGRQSAVPKSYSSSMQPSPLGALSSLSYGVLHGLQPPEARNLASGPLGTDVPMVTGKILSFFKINLQPGIFFSGLRK